MRLIDADALKRKVKAERGGLWAMYVVDSMPTVDAVTVVRCKDCCRSEMCDMEDEGDCRYCHMVEMQVLDDWYCADGERKEE